MTELALAILDYRGELATLKRRLPLYEVESPNRLERLAREGLVAEIDRLATELKAMEAKQ